MTMREKMALAIQKSATKPVSIAHSAASSRAGLDAYFNWNNVEDDPAMIVGSIYTAMIDAAKSGPKAVPVVHEVGE